MVTSTASGNRPSKGRSAALAEYLISWVDYAVEQYRSLDGNASNSLNERLRELAVNPTIGAHYDPGTDHWSATFNHGRGFILYVVNETHSRLIVLRILSMG